MSISRWSPSIPPSRQEKFLLKRCSTKRKLFVFLYDTRRAATIQNLEIAPRKAA